MLIFLGYLLTLMEALLCQLKGPICFYLYLVPRPFLLMLPEVTLFCSVKTNVCSSKDVFMISHGLVVNIKPPWHNLRISQDLTLRSAV